jgi:hypothetical protein
MCAQVEVPKEKDAPLMGGVCAESYPAIRL